MKKLSVILVLTTMLLFSCKKETAETEVTATTSEAEITVPEPAGTAVLTNAVYVYNDSLQVPVRKAEIPQDTELKELVNVVNKYNGDGKVILEYVKHSPDTVYVKIGDSSYLTNQMGTLGAHAYMAVATYTLTEKPGINYVNFDFEEGDHAAPGTYSRESFKQHQ